MNDEKAKRKITTNKKSKNNHLKDTTHNFFALRETLKKNGTNPPQNNKKEHRTQIKAQEQHFFTLIFQLEQ